jgi:hypothetical protein
MTRKRTPLFNIPFFRVAHSAKWLSKTCEAIKKFTPLPTASSEIKAGTGASQRLQVPD